MRSQASCTPTQSLLLLESKLTPSLSVSPFRVQTLTAVVSDCRTEEQLKEAGIQYNKGTFPFAATCRARSVGNHDGSVKVLSDIDTDPILGFHTISPNPL